MVPLSKLITLSLLTAFIGIIADGLTAMINLETQLELSWLFKARGSRPPPPEVIIVTIESEPTAAFTAPSKTTKRPRSDHAAVVRKLSHQGVQVIVFDIFFEKPSDPVQDRLLAEAIREAGQVILVEYLDFDHWQLGGGNARIEMRSPPIPILAQEAIALAPFPLPRVPATLGQCWLFKTGAGDIATLPVVALHIYALPYYDELLRSLRDLVPELTRTLPSDARFMQKNNAVQTLAQELRKIFQTNPPLLEHLSRHLGNETVIPDSQARMALTALVNLHRIGSNLYLDFYGPPGTIPTISYEDILAGRHPPLTGKVVFIGLAQRRPSAQQKLDEFHTPFVRTDGLDLGGVQIAATAFGNLLEGRQIIPSTGRQKLTIFLLWGFLLSTTLVWFPPGKSLPVVSVFTILYLAVAYSLFAWRELWLPLIVPLLIQLPCVVLGALLWRYLDSRQECQKVYETFGYFLPAPVVTDLVHLSGNMGSHGKLIHGVCIATDAGQYTNLSERLSPARLHVLLNDYFGILFQPVTRSGGFISDVVGDAMLALWQANGHDRETRRQACTAAINIIAAVDEFNKILYQSWKTSLPIRIGLHCGDMLLGNVGAGDRYEYRAVGDTVNTTSRIQNLNKKLGTRILVSREMLQDLDEFRYREIGHFRLAGRQRPIIICELRGRKEKITVIEQQRYADFAAGLRAFRDQDWIRASSLFQTLLQRHGDDGPAAYYLRLCRQYSERPPTSSWDGIITLEEK